MPTKSINSRSRKRRKTLNPLSHARSGKDGSRVEELWFRKCRLAPRLFVDYYAMQPIGVVVAGNVSSNAEYDVQTVLPQRLQESRQGQSRASKRRQKKRQRQKITSENVAKDPDASGTTQARDHSATNHNSTKTESNILVQSCLRHDNSRHLLPFVTALSEPQPLTFRIRQSTSPSQFPSIKQTLGNYKEILDPLPFQNAYQGKSSQVTKATLSAVSPQLKHFLLEGSANGLIARQELGSMLPVLALATGGWLCKKHRVLDMCASPGNKLLQALEIIGPKGRIIANDVNPSRLQTLKEAVARSGMVNTDRVRYTNFDASQFPKPEKLFDVILCDVPCSGDGTIRKDSSIMAHWKPNIANDLHTIQVKILVRAIQLLKVGGVVSYSTCSLNPVEDEAVVAAALSFFSGEEARKGDEPLKAELLQWPSMDGFVGRPGVSSWEVAEYRNEEKSDDGDDEESPSLRWLASLESMQDGHDSRPSTLWPPSPSFHRGKNLHLDRCVRLWPQDYNSGGFFVALIRKNRGLGG